MSFGLRDYVERLLEDGENPSSFALWAFGKDYLNITGTDKFADKWNEIHSNLFEINKACEIYQDIVKMVNLWREFGKT